MAALTLIGSAAWAAPALALGEPTPAGGKPTIVGAAVWGETLTNNDAGGFNAASGFPVTSYQREWRRCESAATPPAQCSIIAGATGPNYVLGPGDVGKVMRVRVRARADGCVDPLNETGCYSSFGPFSDPTATVVPNPPDNLARPAFAGTVREGDSLRLTSLGSWNNPTPTRYDVQWLRCNADGLACGRIAGATKTTYRLMGADVGRRIRLRVFATGPTGTGNADSAPSPAVVERSDSSPPAVAEQPVQKGPSDPRPLKPFPKIIVEGVLRGPGVLIRDFVIRGQRNVRVTIRCRGQSCPYRRRSFIKRKRRIHVRSLERRLLSGVRIVIRIRKKGRVGKYTRIRIRSGRVPKRIDRCLDPGVRKPRRCGR